MLIFSEVAKVATVAAQEAQQSTVNGVLRQHLLINYSCFHLSPVMCAIYNLLSSLSVKIIIE